MRIADAPTLRAENRRRVRFSPLLLQAGSSRSWGEEMATGHATAERREIEEMSFEDSDATATATATGR